MPITHDINIPPQSLSRDEFHELDYRVMGLVFAAHNELGRMCDEAVYQELIRLRCGTAGLNPVRAEVQVVVQYEDFRKPYYLDLLVQEGVVYEFKAVNALAGEHQAQLLNYLLLTGLQHGKLVNFRPASAEHRFVTTNLDEDRRRQFHLQDASWKPVSEQCSVLHVRLLALLEDLGAFLHTDLYTEALTHFLGGEGKVIRRVDIVDGEHVLGSQRFHLLDDDTAFRLTAVAKDIQGCEMHLCRLLAHTNLQTLQWINLNQHEITFRTLTRQ